MHLPTTILVVNYLRTDVLGVGFDDYTLPEAVQKGLALAKKRPAGYVVTPNPEIVYMCRKDEQLRSTLHEADMVLADGVGITLGAKILGHPLKGTVPGIDFASGLMALMSAEGLRLFLFGGKPGIAEKAAERLKASYEGLQICGTAGGYFSDSTPIIEEINASGADILFVCLGSPKQELWMRENKGRLDVGLMIGLGGSLDVFSGETKRAPAAWRRLKLEWLYRLLKEPRRIVRMMKLPLFVFRVIGQRLKGGKAGVG